MNTNRKNPVFKYFRPLDADVVNGPVKCFFCNYKAPPCPRKLIAHIAYACSGVPKDIREEFKKSLIDFETRKLKRRNYDGRFLSGLTLRADKPPTGPTPVDDKSGIPMIPMPPVSTTPWGDVPGLCTQGSVVGVSIHTESLVLAAVTKLRSQTKLKTAMLRSFMSLETQNQLSGRGSNYSKYYTNSISLQKNNEGNL